MHFVAETARYAAALEKGFPFFHTACGEAHPVAELTTERSLVDCGVCLSELPPLPVVADHPGTSVSPDGVMSQDLVDDEAFADFDEVEDMLGLDTGGGSLDPGVDSEAHVSEGSQDSGNGLAALGPMLEIAMAGFSPEFPQWRRWLIPLDQEDPEGRLGERGSDLREYLDDEELKFLGQLGQLSVMIGAEGLPMRVLAIIHRLSDQVGQYQDRYADEVAPAEEDGDEGDEGEEGS